MKSINIQKKEKKRELLDKVNIHNECEVSKASTEIMLERFSNGRDIEFPFSF